MLVDTPVALGLFGYADAAKTIAKGYPEGSFLWIVNNIYFQYFSVLITIVSIVVMIVVSYVTKRAGLREDQKPDVRHRRPKKTAGARGPAGIGTTCWPPPSSWRSSSRPTSTSGDKLPFALG